MTAKIKLNAASGGGSFSLQAPSSSSNNRVFTLPDSADATILTSTASLGKILQVKYGFRTGHLSTTSTSYVDSGITVDITPSATTSKVLILINYLGGINGGSTGGQEHQVRILRGVSGTDTEIFTERTADFMRFMVGNAQADYMIAGQFLQNLDSPSTTSAITYKLQCKRSGTGTQNVWAGSNICVMEVAA